MNPRGWRLATKIEIILTTQIGMTNVALADELRVTLAEARPVIGMMIGTGRLDVCGAYLVLPVPPAPRERAA